MLIVCLGREDADYRRPVHALRELVGAYAALEIRHLRPPGAQDGSHAALEREAQLLRRAVPERAYSVALTPEGTEMDTLTFARWMDARSRQALPLVFLVGGAWGLEASLKSDCRERMSLSRLTLSHRVALLTLVEQIYRGLTILNGHPYHK